MSSRAAIAAIIPNIPAITISIRCNHPVLLTLPLYRSCFLDHRNIFRTKHDSQCCATQSDSCPRAAIMHLVRARAAVRALSAAADPEDAASLWCGICDTHSYCYWLLLCSAAPVLLCPIGKNPFLCMDHHICVMLGSRDHD